MLLFTLVLGVWLLPKGETLTCYQCKQRYTLPCKESKPCPLQEHQCASHRKMEFGVSKPPDSEEKVCALPQECGQSSLNIGKYRNFNIFKCCKSDRCNTESAQPDSHKFLPNGKECFTCKGETCTKTLNCVGNEHHCISLTVNRGGVNVTLKGCASELMCSASSIKKYKGDDGAEVSCCQGDLCNSAGGTSAGLLLMAVPLISLVLLS